MNIGNEIRNFFKKILPTDKLDIYNEYSLQFELGWYLRSRLTADFKVQVERSLKSLLNDEKDSQIISPPKTIKNRMDIYIYNNSTNERFAIELKFPVYGQVPYQMYKFVEDIKFAQQLKDCFGFSKTYSVVLVDRDTFYNGSKNKNSIYRFFRTEHKVYGNIAIPIGRLKGDRRIELDSEYPIEWQSLTNGMRYYIIEIDKAIIQNENS